MQYVYLFFRFSLGTGTSRYIVEASTSEGVQLVESPNKQKAIITSL